MRAVTSNLQSGYGQNWLNLAREVHIAKWSSHWTTLGWHVIVVLTVVKDMPKESCPATASALQIRCCYQGAHIR